jgi:phage terminase large subunit-like protein
MLLAGRGFGKTRVGAEWSLMQARRLERGALIGPTAADTRDILVQGESGILACAPATFRPVYEPSKRRLTYPNGAIQMCYSADEPDRLRGPQHHYGWFDELAAWRYLQHAWDMAQLGMRLGDHPQICVTTTPRPLPLVKALLKDPLTAVVRGSTYDNLDNLAPTFRRAVIAKYEGTTLGRQELDAEVLEDLPGALVARRHIDGARVDTAPELINIVVSMDPAGTGAGDETGLVVSGRGADGRNYVLHDASEKLTPDAAANRAWGLLETWSASVLVVEDNGGKDWIESVLKTVWRERRPGDGSPPLRRVNASQGKRLRAQPIAMRYEQGRVSHVGSFPELEDQLTTWIPEEDPNSPDRLDALVHGIAHLMRRHDRSEAILISPHAAKRAGVTEHPAIAARRRAEQRRAS